MKGNTLFTLLLLLLACGQAFAQNQPVDVVTLKDGQRLTGKVKQYEPGKTLVFVKEDGTTVELADSEITKIQQGVAPIAESDNSASRAAPIPEARTLGFYGTSMLSFAGGDSDEGLSLGAGFSQSFGYHLKPYLGIGVGFGIDNYSRRGEVVYPIFAEVRSFLPSKKGTGNFYAFAAGGYAFAFEREQLDITTANGGLMGQFAFGYRAATVEGLDIFVDLGPKFQAAHFERTLYNGDLEVRDVDYKRLVIRVGIGFWKRK